MYSKVVGKGSDYTWQEVTVDVGGLVTCVCFAGGERNSHYEVDRPSSCFGAVRCLRKQLILVSLTLSSLSSECPSPATC